MARIEELPDDSEQSIDLNTIQEALPFPIGSHGSTQEDGTTPALPPQIQSVRSHTADEIVGLLNNTPLFMTSLENINVEDAENVALEGIRALQYEGTPVENAQSFKEQGNEQVKAKRWRDAKEFYTKALAVLSKNLGESVQSGGQTQDTATQERSNAEDLRTKAVEEACYTNRALCNFELKNYRSTTFDCAAALRLNSRNIKAYYRSSQALLALEKIAEATDSCVRGLTIEPSNAALQALADKVKAREEALATAKRKKKQQEERNQSEKAMLTAALRARNVRTRTSAQPPDMEDASIHLAPDPLSPSSTLHFPVIFLYPLHAQSDLIKAFPETDSIHQHLEYILPPPWDEKHEYHMSRVELYMGTREGGLIKVGKRMSLLKILSGGDVEIVDGMVRVNIVLQESAARWIREMKARKGRS